METKINSLAALIKAGEEADRRLNAVEFGTREADEAGTADRIAFQAILEHPCTSLEEVAVKARYVRKYTAGCELNYEQVEALLGSMAETFVPTPVIAAPAACIDEMDAGMDLLRTAWLALQAKGWLDNEGIDAIAATVEKAIARLKPVREKVNSMHGEGRI